MNVLHKQDSSKYLKSSSQPTTHDKVLKRTMRSSVDQGRSSVGSSSQGPKPTVKSIYKLTSGMTERSNTQNCLSNSQERTNSSVLKNKKLVNTSTASAAATAAAQMSGLSNVDISSNKAQQYLYHHPAQLAKNASQKLKNQAY